MPYENRHFAQPVNAWRKVVENGCVPTQLIRNRFFVFTVFARCRHQLRTGGLVYLSFRRRGFRRHRRVRPVAINLRPRWDDPRRRRRHHLYILWRRTFLSVCWWPFKIRIFSWWDQYSAPTTIHYRAVSYTHLTLPTNREV